MNFNEKTFSDEFKNLSMVNPIAKWIYNHVDTRSQSESMGAIERICNLFIKTENELLEIKTKGLQLAVPKVELCFKDTPDQIKQQIAENYFTPIYEASLKPDGPWEQISKEEYKNFDTGVYLAARIIYLPK